MGKFKAFRGKDAYKYLIFKNDARRKSFHSMDSLLKIIYRLTFLAFIASVVGIAVGLMIWILSYVILLGFTIPLSENPGIVTVVFCFLVIPYTVIIYFVVYLLKFIIEWLFILNESRELKKKPEENKNHIVLAGAIKKTKLVGLLTLVVAGVVLFVLAEVFGSGAQLDSWHYVLFAVILVAFIVNKVFSTRTYLKIQPEISAIESDQLKRKQKTN